MKYFKNTELASLYHVSEKSVRNWIDSTVKGKLELELYEIGGRRGIANTTKNHDIIRELVKERKKFTNTRGRKTISPKPLFYKLYNNRQVVDIVKNIDINREIPHHYGYFADGARFWDGYAHRLYNESSPNTLNQTVHLLNTSKEYLLDQIGSRKVNIIDLGPGNCLPIKGLLEILIREGKLSKYIGVDASSDMLSVAHDNIKKWFGDKVIYEEHIVDFTRESFDHITNNLGENTINLVLLLGGTISAARQPEHTLQIIRNSLGKDDILAYSKKLDSENTRRYFDFNVNGKSTRLPFHEMIPGLLNIDTSFYEIEQLFDQERRLRIIQLKLKIDVSIEVYVDGSKVLLDLQKGEVILLWRSWHQTAREVVDQFDDNGFELLQANLASNQEYILSLFKIKQGS